MHVQLLKSCTAVQKCTIGCMYAFLAVKIKARDDEAQFEDGL